ncbi:MAG TPA: redox-sensitive transcriptional activator SoxR, partial [Nocardioidaceae bacterium]|nr:redox-sensitive transcriptional activator SoxR [Nocardioidaceae bacterium]
MSRQPAHLTIGQLAERSGVATSALRYYESQGLIHSERTGGNQRRYPRVTLRRVAFIRSAQRVGLSLEEIAEALATLPEGRTPTKADWARLSRGWRPRL